MEDKMNEWLKLREEKVSITKIAEMYGMSRETLRRRLLEVGAFTGEFHISMEFDKEKIINDYLSGLSIANIAKQNNCTRGTISRFLNKNKIKTRSSEEQVSIERKEGKRKTVNVNFFDNWNSEMAYVLGWLITDGCVLSNLNSFNITSVDIEHLEKLAVLLETDLKILTYNGDGNTKLAGKLSIYNQYMVSKLVKLGITPNKTHSTKMLDVPDEYLGDFFRGVFEGDGTFHVQGKAAKICIYSCCKDFLIQLNDRIISQLNIKSGSVYGVRNDKEHSLYYGGCDRIKMLFDFMYKDIPHSMILDRKYKQFINYFNNEYLFCKGGEKQVDNDKHSGQKRQSNTTKE